MVYWAIATLVLNSADALFTYNAIESGAREANPIMAAVIAVSIVWFLFFKLIFLNTAIAGIAFMGKEYSVTRWGFIITSTMYTGVLIKHFLNLWAT